MPEWTSKTQCCCFFKSKFAFKCYLFLKTTTKGELYPSKIKLTGTWLKNIFSWDAQNNEHSILCYYKILFSNKFCLCEKSLKSSSWLQNGDKGRNWLESTKSWWFKISGRTTVQLQSKRIYITYKHTWCYIVHKPFYGTWPSMVVL